MHGTAVVVIGAGQAGLAVSNLLTAASVGHVVLERGRTAESWRSRRWDSLRLLTPNWMSRLPGWSYRGSGPAGFMSAAEVAGYLGSYADSFDAPVVQGAEVRSVRRWAGGYLVVSDAGSWTADAVVVATGYCDEPAVPAVARDLDPTILQLTPDRYRNPDGVPDGGVLVIGASATGVQLADELAAAGRDVVLAVGRHARMPRRYRGMDIMWWLDSMGLLDRRAGPADAARPPEPSLQIVGRADGREVDLPSLAERGIHVTGRVSGFGSGTVALADDLRITTAAADARLRRPCTGSTSSPPLGGWTARSIRRLARRHRSRCPGTPRRRDWTCAPTGFARRSGQPDTDGGIHGCNCRCWTRPATSGTPRVGPRSPVSWSSGCGGRAGATQRSSTVCGMTPRSSSTT